MNKKKQGKYFFIILAGFAILMIFAWEQNESEMLESKLKRLNIEKQKELSRKMELLMLCNKLKSPEKLYKIVKEYNLVLPNKNDIVEIVVDEK